LRDVRRVAAVDRAAAGVVVVVEINALAAVAKAHLAAFRVIDHLNLERLAAGLSAFGHDLAAGLAGKVDKALGDLAEMKPSVEAFENAKLQAIGGLKLGKLIWVALPFGGGGLAAWLMTHWMAGPKPPIQ
jgi:hypothetical protein